MSHPSDDMAKMPMGKLLAVVCVQALVCTGLGVGLWVLSGRSITKFVTFAPIELGYGVAIAAAMIIAGLVIFKIFSGLGEQLIRDQAHSLAFLKNKLGFGPIIVLSLCAGVWEEALFRGGMLTLAGDYLPFWLALVGTSALFAAIHFAKARVAAFIFIIGCVFGLLYVSLESLLAVMIGHALYDVWAIWYVQDEMHRLGVFDEIGTEQSDPIDEVAQAR